MDIDISGIQITNNTKQIKISEDMFAKKRHREKTNVKMSLLDKQTFIDRTGNQTDDRTGFGYSREASLLLEQSIGRGLSQPKIKCGSKMWNYTEEELSTENQLNALTDIYKKNKQMFKEYYTVFKEYPPEFERLIQIQIQQKIAGYRGQDIEKSLLDETKFVDYPFILELLYNCQLLCYYCRKPTQLIYSIVRDNKQWTLERLNNHYGHNKDNVVIACLHCNIHRKTACSESYVFSKRLKYQGGVIKLE